MGVRAYSVAFLQRSGAVGGCCEVYIAESATEAPGDEPSASITAGPLVQKKLSAPRLPNNAAS